MTSDTPQHDTLPDSELEALREAIDAVDANLLALLNRRAKLALRIGKIKHAEGRAVLQPEREHAVLERLCARNEALGGPLSGDQVENIWRAVFAASRAVQAGPAGQEETGEG